MSARQTTPRQEALATRIAERCGESLVRVASRCGELGYEVAPAGLLAAADLLRTEFAFEMLVDLCAVDYLT